MKTLEFTAIDLELEDQQSRPAQAPEMQEDDLGRPIAPEPTAPTEPVSIYYPITVNPEEMREFYPRKKGKQGTRYVLKNGGAALILKETYDEVAAKFASLNN